VVASGIEEWYYDIQPPFVRALCGEINTQTPQKFTKYRNSFAFTLFFSPNMKMKESKNLKNEVAKWQMANGKHKFSKNRDTYIFNKSVFAICHLPKSEKGIRAKPEF